CAFVPVRGPPGPAGFVPEGGGGLRGPGGRSFAQGGLAGTPLEEVRPGELNDRKGGLVRAALGSIDLPPHNKITLTPDGETHPMMRIGASADETRRMRAALPALAATATVGCPLPGASDRLVTSAPARGIFAAPPR